MTEPEKLVEIERLRREEGYVTVDRRGEDEYVGLRRKIFHWTIQVGTIENHWGYDDGWCYTDDLAAAMSAMDEWKSRNYEGEPAGWQRHPGTGRRRPGGDPSSEYISY